MCSIKTKLSALKTCYLTLGYYERTYNDSGMFTFSIKRHVRLVKLAKKLEASIERDYQRWMVGWLERDEKLYEEMKKNGNN